MTVFTLLAKVYLLVLLEREKDLMISELLLEIATTTSPQLRNSTALVLSKRSRCGPQLTVNRSFVIVCGHMESLCKVGYFERITVSCELKIKQHILSRAKLYLWVFLLFTT